ACRRRGRVHRPVSVPLWRRSRNPAGAPGATRCFPSRIRTDHAYPVMAGLLRSSATTPREDLMRYFAVVMTLAVVLAGCATAAPPQPASSDLTGTWSGSWEGYGVAVIKRYDVASAQFTQDGDRGYGRFWLEGSLASESIPLSLRLAGLTGVPVFFYVDGDRVV